MLLGNFLVYVDLVFTLNPLEDPGVFPRLQAQKILVVDCSRASFILFFFEFDSRREQISTVQALPYDTSQRGRTSSLRVRLQCQRNFSLDLVVMVKT